MLVPAPPHPAGGGGGGGEGGEKLQIFNFQVGLQERAGVVGKVGRASPRAAHSRSSSSRREDCMDLSAPLAGDLSPSNAVRSAGDLAVELLALRGVAPRRAAQRPSKPAPAHSVHCTWTCLSQRDKHHHSSTGAWPHFNRLLRNAGKHRGRRKNWHPPASDPSDTTAKRN